MLFSNLSNFGDFIANNAGYTLTIVACATLVNYGLYYYFIKSSNVLSGFDDNLNIDLTKPDLAIDTGSIDLTKPDLAIDSGSSTITSISRDYVPNLTTGIDSAIDNAGTLIPLPQGPGSVSYLE